MKKTYKVTKMFLGVQAKKMIKIETWDPPRMGFLSTDVKRIERETKISQLIKTYISFPPCVIETHLPPQF
jgi:hypothetical protein